MDTKPTFPFECIEDIFRHLDDCDLLECSLVCSDWNELIGSTRACMNKIKLFTRTNLDEMESTKRIFKASTRKYTRLQLLGKYSKKTKNLISSTGCWKYVSTSENFSFTTVVQFMKFLRTIQHSVEELILDCGDIEDWRMEYFEFWQLRFP